MKELVSVLMSTYNEDINILEESIMSIIKQTYNNIEFIIINDNPKRDDLDQYLQKISRLYDNVIYVKNENNIGLVNSLNKGICMCKGNYIARMDADDVSSVDRIEKQIEFVNENKCDMIGCNVIKIDEKGMAINKLRLPVKHKYIKKFQYYGNCILHPTWLVKKDVYMSLGGYRNIYACEDYDFVVRAMRKGYVLGNVPLFLLYYRVRSSGISVSSAARQLITMQFIANNMGRIESISEDELNKYLESNNCSEKENQYKRLFKDMSEFKSVDCFFEKIRYMYRIVKNKQFFDIFLYKAKRLERNLYCK